MSAYDELPWLGVYDGQPAELPPEHPDALTMYRAGLAADPDGVAIRYFDGVLTRAELEAQSDALASALLAHGFERGDRLAVYLQNVPQFVVCMVATWKAGGVMVSINPMSRARELTYLLADSGARVLVSLETLYDEVAREVVPGTAVDLVLTTSGLEHQQRHDERLFAGVSRARHDGTTEGCTSPAVGCNAREFARIGRSASVEVGNPAGDPRTAFGVLSRVSRCARR